MKKRIISTFFIFVIGVLIVPLFFSTSVSAETDGTPTGFYSYTEVLDTFECVYSNTASNGTITEKYQYQTHYDVTIWTSDPACFGIVSILSNSIRFSGTYSTATLQGRTGTITYINGNVSGTNLNLNKGTGTININGNDSHTEVVLLDDTQLQALINAASSTANLTDIENKLNLVNQYLSYLYNGSFDLEDNSYLELIYNILNGYIETISTTLENIDFSAQSIQLNTITIRNRVNEIKTTLTDLNDKFPTSYGNSVLTKLDTLDTTCNAIITAIDTDFQHLEDNIDNLIDTISFIDITPIIYSSLTNGDYDTENKTSNKLFFRINVPQTKEAMFKIIFPVYASASFMRTIDFTYTIYDNYGNILNNSTVYQYLYGNNLAILVNPGNLLTSSSSYLYVSVETSKGTFSYNNNLTKKVSYIENNDIEYWDLLYYIKSFRFHDQMIKEIETTDNLNNINSQLQQNSQQMFNQEEQFNNNFNSSLGAITLPDNPFNNFGTMFGQSSRFLVYMFDQMTTTRSSPFGTVITFSLLLGLALLMIGKKGR